MLELNRQPGPRRCAASDRPIGPGEDYFSAAREVNGSLARLDYLADAWPGPPEGCVAWWRSRAPEAGRPANRAAPGETLIGLINDLADDPQRADTRYVLALLMVRRKLLRPLDADSDDPPEAATAQEGVGQDPPGELDPACGGATLRLEDPSTGTVYRVAVASPDRARAAEIQAELDALLSPPTDPQT